MMMVMMAMVRLVMGLKIDDSHKFDDCYHDHDPAQLLTKSVMILMIMMVIMIVMIT